jgi:hypothetical protein
MTYQIYFDQPLVGWVSVVAEGETKEGAIAAARRALVHMDDARVVRVRELACDIQRAQRREFIAPTDGERA